jgi:hypothetical protein
MLVLAPQSALPSVKSVGAHGNARSHHEYRSCTEAHASTDALPVIVSKLCPVLLQRLHYEIIAKDVIGAVTHPLSTSGLPGFAADSVAST